MANPQTELTVTSDDLQEKWQEVQEAVRERVEQKVVGVSYLTIGLIAVGVGVLGTAYYLGRHSAEHTRSAPEGHLAPPASQPARPVRSADGGLSKVLEPVLDQALRATVTAVMDRLKQPPSPQ